MVTSKTSARLERRMQVLDIIENAQAGDAMANLAQRLGITEDQARAAAAAALPELAHAVERNTLSRGGLADLVRALGDGHHEALLEAPDAWLDPRVAQDGQAILVHMLGSPAKVDALSAQAARAAGLSDSIIKMLLPILAQMLMGAISRYAKGGLGDILSRLPGAGGAGGAPQSPRSGDSGPMGGGRGFELPKSDMPSGGYRLPPFSGSTGGGEATPSSRPAAPPRDEPSGLPWPLPGGRRGSRRDGEEGANPGGFDLPRGELPPIGGHPLPPMPPSNDLPESRRGNDGPSGMPFPFPMPGQKTGPNGNNPYGDLSDIIRRGGRMPSGVDGDGGLWSVVRNMLGGALGFGGRGVIGWLIQLILVRWGWRFLKRILTGR